MARDEEIYDRAVELMSRWGSETRRAARGVGLGAGDLALRDVLTFHGTAMNGGVSHAVDTYRDDRHLPVDRVVAGFELLGMKGPAALVVAVRDAQAAGADPEELEETMDPRYGEFDDEYLQDALREAVEARPSLFA